MSCPAHELAVSRRMLDYEDVDLIRELVAMLPTDRPVNIIDLGAGSGTTAGAVYAERPDANVWTFDISEENIGWAHQFLSNIGVGAQWRGTVMDSVEAAHEYAARNVDMLLIDTSHDYEPTVRELAAWLPLLRDPALVWCHDFRGLYPGVTRAVEEAVARGELECIAVRGLGWGGRSSLVWAR